MSIAAIRASSSIGNEVAIPHLVKIIGSGTTAQRIAAIEATAEIAAPSSIDRLIKYFSFFKELALKRKILEALNRIAPYSDKVQEVNRAVILTPAQAPTVMETAMKGLVDANNLNAVQGYLRTASPRLQKTAFEALLHSGGTGVGAFIESFQDLAGSFHPDILGCYLCAFMIRASTSKQKFVFETLKNADHDVVVAFLNSLVSYTGSLENPRQIFRLMLTIAYISPESEALIGEIVERIVDVIRKRFPHLLSYVALMTSTHLETVFGKIKKGFLSMKGVKGKSTLLIILLAKIVEKYTSSDLLNKIQNYFQASLLTPYQPIVEEIRKSMRGAPEEDVNRFNACMALFQVKDTRIRLIISSNLSYINLDRPNLLRRLNRLVRIAGNFQIKQSIAKLVEILQFARDERIDFLEETTVVTLCQLFHRGTIEDIKRFLAEPTKNTVSLNGYSRGLRYLPARLLFHPFLKLLVNPGLYAYTRDTIIDSIAHWDISGIKNAVPAMLQVVESPHLEVAQKMKLGEIVAKHGESSLFQTLIDLTSAGDDKIRIIAVRSLKAIAKRDPNVLMDVLTNRLYAMLDRDTKEVQIQALLALIELGDDYALSVLKDQLTNQGESYVAAILAELMNQINHEILQVTLALLSSPSSIIQHALRDTLASHIHGNFAEEIRYELINRLKNSQRSSAAGAPAQRKEVKVDDAAVMQHAKIEFKIKRENSQVLTVFFIDIVSYTERTSVSDATTIIDLIRSFEDLVIPEIERFKGSLVKKMGDGMLAVFKHPVNATLAALSIQRRIGEYNEFRVGKEKFSVRIGLNTGMVIRKDEDVFGNVVNIASRMETTAKPGEILLTRDTHEEIKEYINCTPLGNVQVKGIRDAILVYSAESAKENALKLQKAAAGGEEQAAEAEEPELSELSFTPKFHLPANLPIDSDIPKALQKTFEDLTRAAEEIAADYQQENAFNTYLQTKWNELMQQIEKTAVGG